MTWALQPSTETFHFTLAHDGVTAHTTIETRLPLPIGILAPMADAVTGALRQALHLDFDPPDWPEFKEFVATSLKEHSC